MHVPAGMRQAYLISIPRDLLVAIPPAPTATAAARTRSTRRTSTAAAAQAGARLLSATLTRLTGIRFDGAALVDFSGFRKVIDLLGGVQMCVDTEVRSIHTRPLFPVGCQQMDGAGRWTTSGSATTCPAATTTGSATSSSCSGRCWTGPARRDLRSDPVKLDQVLRAVGGSLTVDTNGVPLEDLLLALRACPPDALRGVQVPSYPQTIDEVSYVVLDNGGNGLFDGAPRHPAARLGAGQPALGQPVVTRRRPGRCRTGPRI